MKDGGKVKERMVMLFREQKELRSEKNSNDFNGKVKKMEFFRRWGPKCVYQHMGKSW